MRILVVTDNRFWREQIGSQRRISSLCQHLRNQGHELSIIFAGHLYPVDESLLTSGHFPYSIESFGRLTEQPAGTGQGVPVSARLRTSLRKILSQGRAQLARWRDASVRGRRLMLTLQWREPKLRDFIDERVCQRFLASCERVQPELVIVEYLRLSYVLDICRAAIPIGCRSLIDTHDVQSERQERFHACGQVHDIDITPAEEAQALSLADAVIAIQPTDAAKFLAMCPKLKVVVAGFPEPIFEHPVRDNPDYVVRIGFFGSDMPPNRDAARFLVVKLFPTLRQQFGERVELHIFGNVCGGLLGIDTVPGVIVHGFVDDLVSAYAEIDVVANPIAFGGGLKIKNVEALCHGRALLTTPLGAEGLEKGAGIGFWVADGESEFARRLEELVSDEPGRRRLSGAALAYARSHLSADVVYAEMDAFIRDACQC